MSCLNPIFIKVLDSRTNTYSYQKVRCRNCEDCKQSSRSAAFVRLNYEYEHCIKSGGFALFFTLTFADEYVPFKFHRMCFDKKLVQNWLQNFRQIFRRRYGLVVKYFLVSELGHVGTHRPHHHGEFFFYPNDKYQLKSWKSGKNKEKIPAFPQTYAQIISSLWNYGRCDISVLDPSKGGHHYVSKYIAKDYSEENLFKDIITRIQIKRGKGSLDIGKINYYYSNVFPSLYAFRCRYCPFVMISQGLGSSAPVTEKMLVEDSPLSIGGFDYKIPRYYSDRYLRNIQKEYAPYVNLNSDKEYINFTPNYRNYEFRTTKICHENCYSQEKVLTSVLKKCEVPISNYDKFVLPSDKILNRYKRYTSLFDFVYFHVPLYKERFSRLGVRSKVKYLPKLSEINDLKVKRNKYIYSHLLDLIETKYFNLPLMLQNSCNYDIPKLLLEAKNVIGNNLADDEVLVYTDTAHYILCELEELSRVHSEWRANSRIAKMEQKRKEKIALNQSKAKSPLTWSEYKNKSLYFGLF